MGSRVIRELEQKYCSGVQGKATDGDMGNKLVIFCIDAL